MNKSQLKKAEQLHSLMTELEEQKAYVKSLELTVSEQKDDLFESLGSGNFVSDNFVLCLDKATRKGRVTTSWKSVTEETISTLNNLISSYGIKYEESASVLNKLGRNFDKRFNAMIDGNTKEGKPSETIKVDFKALSK